MGSLAANFATGAAASGGALALIAVVLVLIALGAACGGRQRFVEADLVVGWGFACVLFTLFGTATDISFAWIAAVVAVTALAVAWAEWRSPVGFARVAVLAAPLVVLVAAMHPSQWDEFTHWLPNAGFLYAHDGFPRTDLPPSPSLWPAYPYGLALPVYGASLIAGHFAENAGALFNLALLLSFAAMLARLMAPEPGRPGWALCAAGLLAATFLNPSFVPKIAFTAYADSATGVALGIGAVLAWLALDAAARGEQARARALALQCGFALTALVSIKQVDAVLVAALTVALALVAWRDPAIGLGRAARLAPWMLILPIVVYVAWRIHVAVNIPGGEFAFRPMSEWTLGALGERLARMGSVAAQKGGHFGLMLIALGFAGRALWRTRTPFDRLALIVGVVFVLYNAFLAFTYIAAFSDYEGERVASYWRYSTHLGPLGVAFAVYGLALLWRRHRPRWSSALGAAAILLAVATPIALAGKLRFDIRAPKLYVRAVAEEMAGLLGRDDRLAVIDASGDGTYAMMVRYVLGPRVRMLAGDPQMPESLVRGVLSNTGVDAAWIHVPTPAIDAALGMTLAPRASHLLKRENGRWTEIKSWPYPGYASPADIAG
jgi:hypothetical protein